MRTHADPADAVHVVMGRIKNALGPLDRHVAVDPLSGAVVLAVGGLVLEDEIAELVARWRKVKPRKSTRPEL